MASLVAAGLDLAAASGPWLLMLGVCLWGRHLGLSRGLLAAMIADSAPAERSGTAFGVFNFVRGIAMLLASVVAGVLRDRYGAVRPSSPGRPWPASPWSARLLGPVSGDGRIRREEGGLNEEHRPVPEGTR